MSRVEFVDYTGEFPCLCSGEVTLKIDGQVVKFVKYKCESEELSMTKVEMIKKAIKDKTYDWEAAIKGAAERILEHPESLLWR